MGFFDDLVKQVTAPIQQVGNAASGALQGVSTGLNNALRPGADLLQRGASDINSAVNSNIIAPIGTAANSISNNLQGLAGNIFGGGNSGPVKPQWDQAALGLAPRPTNPQTVEDWALEYEYAKRDRDFFHPSNENRKDHNIHADNVRKQLENAMAARDPGGISTATQNGAYTDITTTPSIQNGFPLPTKQESTIDPTTGKLLSQYEFKPTEIQGGSQWANMAKGQNAQALQNTLGANQWGMNQGLAAQSQGLARRGGVDSSIWGGLAGQAQNNLLTQNQQSRRASQSAGTDIGLAANKMDQSASLANAKNQAQAGTINQQNQLAGVDSQNKWNQYLQQENTKRQIGLSKWNSYN